jgi:outer membrane protein OmpA-like peptidoglycan-associated protein
MNSKILAVLIAVCAVVSGPTPAQTEPSAAQMIEQLKSPPRTRSLRNLAVKAQQDPTATSDSGPTPQSATSNAAGIDAPTGPAALSLQIQFEFNSAQVSGGSQRALASLAQALQAPELRSSNFAIEGHTDAKGRADYNLKLSAQRARAVSDILKSHGVDEARLVPIGKGSTALSSADQPFAPENRRVRIVNLD